MSEGDVRSGWRRGALADPDRPGVCFRRVGDDPGINPRPCAAGIRQGARRTGEPALEVRGPGAGGAIGRSASACPWRRSVSARRADPPTASTSARRSSGPVLGLRRPDRVGVQDRPRPLDSRRPVLPALPGCSRKAAPGSRGDPRPRGPSRSTRHWDPRRPGGCRAPGRRAPGWPGAPRVGRMRAPESDRRRAGPDGAHHRARQGEPGPRRPAAPRLPPPPGADRRWVVDFTYVPTRHGVPRCTAFVTGSVREGRIVGWATSTRTGRRGAASALEQATRGAQAPRRRPAPGGLVHHSDHGSKSPVHRLHRTTRRRGHRSPRPEPRAPPCAGAAAQAPGKPPASAGPVLARRPPRDRDDPPGPQPPAG